MRALPRLVFLAGGVVLMARTTGVTWWVGLVLMILTLSPSPHPWWRRIMTGRFRPVCSEFTSQGDFQVELVSAGANPIEVLKAVREVTDIEFSEVRALVLERASGTVATSLNEESAELVCRRIEEAGGSANKTEITVEG